MSTIQMTNNETLEHIDQSGVTNVFSSLDQFVYAHFAYLL